MFRSKLIGKLSAESVKSVLKKLETDNNGGDTGDCPSVQLLHRRHT